MRSLDRNLWWYLPPVVVVGVFFGSLPWLKEADDGLVSLAATAASLSVIVWAILLSLRVERSLDEVQRASQRFAVRYGMTAGTMAFALLLMVAPFKDFATAFVIAYGKPGPGMTVDRSVVVFAMMLGFIGVTLLQLVGTLVMTAIWWRAKQ